MLGPVVVNACYLPVAGVGEHWIGRPDELAQQAEVPEPWAAEVGALRRAAGFRAGREVVQSEQIGRLNADLPLPQLRFAVPVQRRHRAGAGGGAGRGDRAAIDAAGREGARGCAGQWPPVEPVLAGEPRFRRVGPRRRLGRRVGCPPDEAAGWALRSDLGPLLRERGLAGAVVRCGTARGVMRAARGGDDERCAEAGAASDGEGARG